MESKTLPMGLVIIAIITLIAGIAVSVGTDDEHSEAGRFIVTAKTQSEIYVVTVTTVTPSSDDLLGKYERNDKRLKKYDFEDVTVYFHQRMIDDAIVEGDYIVYQFDRNTKELLHKRTHWLSGLPEHVTPLITKEQAESLVRGEIQFTKLYIISPDSVVLPLKPTPDNPCWVVRSVDNGSTIVTIIDAMDGKMFGYGIPPPTGFSFSGPRDTLNCTGVWSAWYRNAALWFNTMGYPTEAMTYPDEAKVKSHIQSNETVMFYELAHGSSWRFANNCSDYTDADEIHNWIESYAKMPFAFIGSCGGMCDLTSNHLSYEFRKGSMINTTTVGYCGMRTEDCEQAWSNSVNWQDAMFDCMNQGDTVKEAFDNAMADYPMCVGCVRFAGDENFAVVPVVDRVTLLTDVYEPDDNYNQADWISTDGTKQYHGFYVPGDHDWLQFNATANMPYKIETSYIGEESDTYIYLYDRDGITEITQDDDGGEGLASKIIWSCATTGTYYVMVRHYSPSSSGPDTYYHISVSPCPPPTFNNVYADYGDDTDGDGLYNYLTIDVGVDVAIAGYYEVEGCLYDDLGNYVEKRSNCTYLNTGNQIVQLDFDGFKIRKNGAKGTFDLKQLYLSNTTDWTQLDYIYDAYTTSYYNYTDFQISPAEFSDIYSDYGGDTDGDGLYDYMVVDVGVNVTEPGYYGISGSLYDELGNYVVQKSNHTYLDSNHSVTLKFSGIEIRKNGVNGTFNLKRLYLEDENYNEVDYRYAAYTTPYYNWTEFEIPPAEFSDIYADYGEDTDGNGLYDYLVVNVGVNVTEAGDYRVSGELYENGTYNSVGYAYNTTYLIEGNRTAQLMFDARKITKSGTFDLKYLYLYNSSTGVRLDYRYYAYTTGYYEPLPRPALFNNVYSDYGESATIEDDLYDYLVINIGVNVTEVGDYRVSGGLYESGTYNYVDYAYNATYLNPGNQTIQLRFEGIKIRNNEYNGTYDLKYLELYNETYPYPVPTPTPTPASQHESKSTETEGISVGYEEQLDYRYYAYTTSYYNYTEFEESIPGAYEPDNNYSLANYISVDGTKQTHNFHVPGDQDWLKFNATEGSSYTIETSELGNESDTYFYLYDTDGTTEIYHDDDSGIGLASKIIWNCSISGTYYVMVRHHSSSAFGPETRCNISITVKEAPPNGPYNNIHFGEVAPILIGQELNFVGTNWSYIPVVIFGDPDDDEIAGDVFSADSNNHFDSSVITKSGTYYVNLNHIDKTKSDAILCVAIPAMYLDLKVGTNSVSNITRGTPLRIDFTSNLDANDLVDLRVRDPDGYILKVNPADPTQKFDDIKVGKLMEYESMNESKQINTTGWTLGIYEFYVRTEKEYAQGLDMCSNAKTLTVTKECTHPNESWNVTISATNQLEPIVVGMHPKATDGYDSEFDEFIQTPVQGKVILILDDVYSKSSKKTKCYSELVSWNLSVGVPIGETTTLSWDDPSNVNLTIFEGDAILSSGSQLSEGIHELTVTAELLEYQEFSINLKAGWNMISIPVITDNNSVQAIFGGIPTVDTMSVKTWQAPIFINATEIQPKIGYWVFTPTDTTINVTGEPITNTTLNLKAGWNMVGTVGMENLSISAILNQVPQRPAVTWVAPSFVETNVIEPGKSAWVFVTADTIVTVSVSAEMKTKAVSTITKIESVITSATTEEWNLIISATNQLEPVTFGIHPNATNGYDEYDAFVQTPVQGKVILILDDIYATEINRDKLTWNLSVGVPIGETTTLIWDPSKIPADFTLTLDGTDMKLHNSMELGEGSYLFVIKGNIGETTAILDTGTPENQYPSIRGNHTGTIKPNHTVITTKMYTYPCIGTGGHTEYVWIYGNGINESVSWKGYRGDWHNISFNNAFTLVANETYNYTIRTGSYPQIHHTDALPTTNGWINCTQFTDTNGKKYKNWIPAIKLFL